MSIKNNYMYLHCNFISTKIHCANHKYILKTIECPWFKIWKWKQKPSDKSAPHKLNDYVVFLGIQATAVLIVSCTEHLQERWSLLFDNLQNTQLCPKIILY